MGVTTLIVGAIWLKSFLTYRDKQGKTADGMKKKRKMPIRVDTDFFGG